MLISERSRKGIKKSPATGRQADLCAVKYCAHMRWRHCWATNEAGERVLICALCQQAHAFKKRRFRTFSPALSKKCRGNQHARKDDHERFEKYTMPEPMSGCLLWIGAPGPNGYGHMRFRGRSIGAHRAAWVLAGNDLREGVDILHKCDNRSCCEIRHLFEGNNASNSRDMALKGRGHVGKRGLPYGAVLAGDRFVSNVRRGNKRYYLGTFDTADEASRVALAFKRASEINAIQLPPKRLMVNNKTGLPFGVSRRGSMFQSRVCIHGVKYDLGLWPTLEAAYCAVVEFKVFRGWQL